MQYFPIFVDGQKLDVLVVGGGDVATRKVELMLKTPAKVTVVAPSLSKTITELKQQQKIQHIDGRYDKRLLVGKQLVFVATANRELNRQISIDARAAGVLANVVDDPELCHFITPSIVDRAPMIFAISSEGNSPVLVRYWREKLETILPQTMGKIATFAGNQRRQIKQQLDSITKRRNFWEKFFSSARSEQPDQLEPLYNELIAKVENNQLVTGELYVVEAPLQPDLLSLAALRHMQKADIAIYDDGINGAIIELVRRDADRESVTSEPLIQLDGLLKQGLRVCYLSSRPLNHQSELWQKIKHNNYPVSAFSSANDLEV
ncbi:MAG: siroheme synthase [Gammaproteobacteria bacterium]|nr:siroheme synthase [Gammaproteobacteria bacterium]